MDDDERWMTRAIELARSADYRTSPNPMVGAVVLDGNGKVAGEGFHAAKGSAHAEEAALAAAGPKAEGGTIYVSLEPCTHGHRSTPCAAAIVSAGIRRVVVAMPDPDERVRGAGIDRLKAAGLQVEVGTCAAAAKRLNEFYVTQRTTGRPFVSLKFAMSLDGKIATRTGESRWITGDPQLTARIEGRDKRQPLRVVLDTHLRTPKNARVLGERTLIATSSAGDMEFAELLRLPPGPDGRVPIEALLDQLGQRGILSLLVEGGAQTHASFLAAGLVDKGYAYIAPRLIGGSEAPGPVGGDGIERLSDTLRLRDTDVVALGDDILISGYVDVHRDS